MANGVYDLPEDMGEQIDDNTVDTGIKSYRERVDELCGAIDQNMAWLDNYLNDLKLADVRSWEYYMAEVQKAVDEYNSYKNQAYGLQAEAADQSRMQSMINSLQYILDYSENLLNSLSQQFSGSAPTDIPMSDLEVANGGGGQTAMVTASGNGNDVIVMEEAGAIRAWWDGLSDSTKGMMKAAGIALTIWGGKKLFNYAMENWKKESFEERIDLDEPEVDDQLEV